MKITKKAENVSDANDSDKCIFTPKDIRVYVFRLRAYLLSNKNKLTVSECSAISHEIQAWHGFFKMVDRLSVAEPFVDRRRKANK